MQIHYLKTVNPFFQAVWDKIKTFEIRLDDRGFEPGDALDLIEHDSLTKATTGREILVLVPYILKGEPYLPPKYVCMSIQEINRMGG